MSAENWYRNTKWNDSIRESFFKKLSRARSQRDQYLVIQALTLAETTPQVCLELVNHYFETRKDNYEDVRALLARVKAHEKLEDLKETIEAYHAVLKREEEFPNHLTTAYVDFPYLVAVNQIDCEYDFALSTLSKNVERLTFPLDSFKWYAAKALIEDRKDYAQKALEVAEVKRSGFRYHQNIGLVGKEHKNTIKTLLKK